MKIEDTFPPYGMPILVSDGKTVTVCCLEEGTGTPYMGGHGFGGYEWDFDLRFDDLTHWTPLPEPPQ
jgi:hypothetical protein